MTEINKQVTDQQTGETTLLDIALSFAENLRTLILVPLAAGIAAAAISALVPPTYTAITRILPPANQQSASAALAAHVGVLAGLITGPGGIKNPADQYVALLKSRSVYDALIERYQLKELYGVHYTEDARKELINRTKVFAGTKDGIVSIEVEDRDPKRAADIANAFVEELRNLTNTLAINEAAQRRLFFEVQLKLANTNLTKAEIALRGSGVSETALRTLPQSALEALARLKAQITAQEIKLASMRTFMTDSNPEYRLALQELAALRIELSRAEQGNTLKAVGAGAEYIAKYREFKYHETLFELMAKQYELARLDEAREAAVIQVVDRAMPPERKSSPKRALIAALVTVATFLVLALVVSWRYVLSKRSTEPEFARKIARLRRLLTFRQT